MGSLVERLGASAQISRITMAMALWIAMTQIAQILSCAQVQWMPSVALHAMALLHQLRPLAVAVVDCKDLAGLRPHMR
jgi:hypothetical protein